MLPVYAAYDLGELYTPGKALGGQSATFGKLVSPLIQNIIIICAIGGFLFLIFTGFSYITAGGDKQKIENASQSINYVIIGLALIVSAYVITVIIGKIVGIDFFNP